MTDDEELPILSAGMVRLWTPRQEGDANQVYAAKVTHFEWTFLKEEEKDEPGPEDH